MLTFIVMVGCVVRLLLAPMEGNGYDVGLNISWGRSTLEHGLGKAYREHEKNAMKPNYPPLSLLFFGGMSFLDQQILLPFLPDAQVRERVAIKMGSLLADLTLAILLYFLLRKLRGDGWGLFAAAAYALHPAVLYDGAVWGQNDGVYTVFMVAALFAMGKQHWFIAGLLAMLSFLVKMQTVAITPLLGFVLLLYPRAIPRFLLGGAAALAAVVGPFFIEGTQRDVWDMYVHSVGFYPIISSAAYNFWWSLFADEAGNIEDSKLLFNLIEYRTAGLLLFAASCTFALLALRRQLHAITQPRVFFSALFTVAALSAHAFFLFNTQMHERYLFPFVAFGLPVAILLPSFVTLYIVISLLYLLNLMGWLPLSIIDRTLYSEFPYFDGLIASMQVVAFIFFVRFILTLRKTLIVPGKKKWSLKLPLFPSLGLLRK